jgi:hypothetical protein
MLAVGAVAPGVPADRLDDHERSIAAAESKECGNKYCTRISRKL